MAAPPETRYAELDGLNIAYQVVGEGERDLLYIADVRGPIDLVWDDPLAAHGLRRLARMGRLITCEMRGMGASDDVDFGSIPVIQGWMDDIGAVLDAAGSERATIFAAEPEEGLSAMLYTASHPERVEGLVLYNPYACFLRSAEQPWGLPAARLDDYVHAYVSQAGRGPNVEFLAPSRADEATFRRWFTRGERLGVRPRSVEPLIRGFFTSDVTHVLPSIRVPTLILARRACRHVRVEHARIAAERIPDARLVELEGEDTIWYGRDVDELIDEIEAFVGGASRWGHSDRVLATVLFTDIVDSTERAAAAGDAAWAELLDAHDEIVRGHVSGFGGRWIKSLGDGALATFDGPARAIRCALGLREALSARGIDTRAGLHTGEVERREEDIGGLAVHIAARIAALAGPDEVLVSGAVPPLVVGDRLRFRAAGTHQLKGVPDPWPVFCVEDD
jgi:class 3 adenylate cyclase